MKAVFRGMVVVVLAVTAAALAGEVVLADEGDHRWEKVGEKQGITVFIREKKGSEVKEVKAVGFIDAPPQRVWKVINDFDHFKDFMPYMHESRVVKREGGIVFFYGHISPPLISDRDYTIRLTSEIDAGGRPGHYRSTWTEANQAGPPKRDGVVRVEINKGYWYLEPADGGKKTRSTYYLYTNPGGYVPTFIVNRANRSTVPDIIKAVRKRMKDKRYD